MVRMCIGTGRSANFRDWVVYLKACGAVEGMRNLHELEVHRMVLDLLIEESGVASEAAKRPPFEVIARRVQGLLLLDKNVGGEGALLAAVMMGPYAQSRLPIAPTAMSALRNLAISVGKTRRSGGGGD